ncbi:acid protease [Gyrodon lividus]|nr:acid protease [Gyrodon lividus]
MFSTNFITLALISSNVLLASNALAIPTDGNDSLDTNSFKGFAFEATLTPRNNKQGADNNTLLTITNESNLEYTGKVNVGGHDFTIIIDTGSSDLWITTSEKIKITTNTNTNVNLTYGIGSAYGNIAYTTVSFGGYQVENQAFVNVQKTLDMTGQGILGLGLIGLSEVARESKTKTAQPIMANIFTQHPSTPMFVGLALERSEDGEDTSGGVLSIGEYDPQFSNISGTSKHPVTPTSSSRWTIAMSKMTVNGKDYTLKSDVQGTKKGQAIALIDSGTSLAYIPSDAVDAIYSVIDGAVHVKTNDQDSWYVPCLSQSNVSFTFGSDTYPINPMELTTPVTITDNGKQYTVCLNAFQAPLNGEQADLDFLLGDIFMRNVYSVFNFGNSTTPGDDTKSSSIQFLSRTNQDQVYQNFADNRKQSLRAHPPLFDLTKLKSDGSTTDGHHLDDSQS